MTTIATATSYFPRKIRRLEIQKPDLNKDNVYNISRIWKIILPVTEN